MFEFTVTIFLLLAGFGVVILVVVDKPNKVDGLSLVALFLVLCVIILTVVGHADGKRIDKMTETCSEYGLVYVDMGGTTEFCLTEDGRLTPFALLEEQ